MTNESPHDAAARLVRETRATAPSLAFHERADLVRELVKAVRDAVKFEPLPVGTAPGGITWELDGLATVGDAAENYYYVAAQAKLRAEGRL